MKKSILVLVALFVFTVIQATPPPPTITLATQDEVDNFVLTLVTGNLIISGNDIDDLSPLSSLTTINVNLNIEDCPLLPNLDGLTSLDSVGGSLTISNNPLLNNLVGLSSLHAVVSITITDNPELDVIEDFCGLYTVISTVKFQTLGTYNIPTGNGIDPSEQDIIDGGACVSPSPSVPLSNWAIYMGIVLIAIFMFVGYKRRLFA